MLNNGFRGKVSIEETRVSTTEVTVSPRPTEGTTSLCWVGLLLRQSLLFVDTEHLAFLIH